MGNYLRNQGRNLHPEISSITSLSALKRSIDEFNHLSQDELCRRSGYTINLSNIFSTLEEHIGSTLIHGTLSLGKTPYHIQLKLPDLLQMKDMIRSLRGTSSTPTATPSPQMAQDNICCICLDQQIDRMLPCSHCYCSQCTKVYILDKEEKICPKCREDYSQGEGIHKKLVDIFVDEEEIAGILCTNIRELLLKTNPQLRHVI